MSTVLEDTDICVKKYRCAIAIYLMTVLSYLYGILMGSTINAPGHGNNFVNTINVTDKIYLREQMELLVKLASNETSNTGMITSASHGVSVNFWNNFYTLSLMIMGLKD